MELLLKTRGNCLVKTGKYKGSKYADLSEEAVRKLAKRSPSEPELGQFCRALLALIQLETEFSLPEDSAASSNQGANAASDNSSAVVPYVHSGGPKKCKNANSTVNWREEIYKKCLLPLVPESFWDLEFPAKFMYGLLAVIVLGSIFGTVFLAATSPAVAKKAGKAAGEMVQLGFGRVIDFWNTFQTSMFSQLGFYYEDFKEDHTEQVGHVLAEPEAIGHTMAARPAPQKQVRSRGDFVHDIGAATIGSLMTLMAVAAMKLLG